MNTLKYFYYICLLKRRENVTLVEVVNEEYVPITNVTKNKQKYQNNLKENILHVRNNQYTERKTYTDNSLKLIMLNSRT